MNSNIDNLTLWGQRCICGSVFSELPQQLNGREPGRWDQGDIELFVHHRSRTIGAIHLLNNTLEPRLFIGEAEPSHNPERERAVTSVGVQTEDHGRPDGGAEHGRGAHTPECQSDGGTSVELDVTGFSSEEEKPVEPGSNEGAMFKTGNTNSALISAIEYGGPDQIIIKLRKTVNSGPPRGYPLIREASKGETDRRRYLCGYCDRPYYWRSSLYRHVKTDHRMKGQRCPHCDVPFTYKVALDIHVSSRCQTGWCRIQTPLEASSKDIIVTPIIIDSTKEKDVTLVFNAN